MSTFKELKSTSPLNDYPSGKAIAELIAKLRSDEGELDASMAIARRFKTSGYNSAMDELLEMIEEHRYGIKPITTEEK
jgi:hypothetical protein